MMSEKREAAGGKKEYKSNAAVDGLKRHKAKSKD
jgi:hypothetical protein